MKTAVEWLVEKHFGSIENCSPNFRKHIEQANKMFEEQIINSFEIGYDNGACVQEGNAIYHGNNYYKLTFKSE